jgi:tetratricopeptide (TPR) repeat protein
MTRDRGEGNDDNRPRPGALLGELVVFTGRLATMSRRAAARVAECAGGRVAPGVSRRCTMLVVGARGLPLLETGALPRSLHRAEELREAGVRLRILTERTFRELIGLDAAPAVEGKTLEAVQVAAALGIEPRVLERWEHLGLVPSSGGRYDFRDLVSLRTVTDLVARGVRPLVIQRSLEGLTGLIAGVDRPLAQLKILVSDAGRLVAELEDALLSPGGQLELKFDRTANPVDGEALTLVAAEDYRDAAAWVAAGLGHEGTGDLAQAERAYRRAIRLDPSDPSAQLNLGNVLLERGRPDAAVERFAQAAALDPDCARAWYNLAYAQDELGRRRAALVSLRRAVRADPTFADARYNLAELCERMDEREEAARNWAEYLRLEPGGDWASEARRRLAVLRSPAWA